MGFMNLPDGMTEADLPGNSAFDIALDKAIEYVTKEEVLEICEECREQCNYAEYDLIALDLTEADYDFSGCLNRVVSVDMRDRSEFVTLKLAMDCPYVEKSLVFDAEMELER